MWLLAYRYEDEGAAGVDYQSLRDYLLANDLDMTVYRIMLNSVWHVVSVSDGVPDLRIVKEMRRGFKAGTSVELPKEVADALQARRKEGSIPGVFWEANHRSGLSSRRRRAKAS